MPKIVSALRAALLAFVLFAVPVRVLAVEKINQFNASYTIQDTGAVQVTETIVYDFGDARKHGIYRDIPLTAPNGPTLKIEGEQVADEAGNLYQYVVTREGDTERIKIGDPNATVSGIKTYIIRYTVYNAIRDFADHNELYWNVTGNGWQVAIEQVNAAVSIAGAVPPTVHTKCFTGEWGSTAELCTIANVGNGTVYQTNVPLGSQEGMTIVYGFPTSTIHNTLVPTDAGTVSSVDASWYVLFGVICLPFLFVPFLIAGSIKRFRKPQPVIPPELKHRSIIAEYAPPAGMAPIEVGTLVDRRVDASDITAVIIDLAIRGYLTIEYRTKEIPLWWDAKDFNLVKLKSADTLTHPVDKIVFDVLFGGRSSVYVSDLKKEQAAFRTEMTDVINQTEERLFSEGYFDRRKQKVVVKALVGFAVFFVALLFFLNNLERLPRVVAFLQSSLPGLVLVFVAVFLVIVVAVARFGHALTPKGVDTLAKILGFREYLSVAEKDRIKFFNSPRVEPATFEKFLPYAIVLGVEEEWAKQFEGIEFSAPRWYADGSGTHFNSVLFVNSLSSFNKSFMSTYMSATASSGFSGGSVGGGSGGGGGGSW